MTDKSPPCRASLASENLTKAYELRERVSEQERYWISANYYSVVTGELEKANQICELWAPSYPRSIRKSKSRVRLDRVHLAGRVAIVG